MGGYISSINGANPDLDCWLLVILEHCNWSERNTCMLLTKGLREVSHTNSFYHWCCKLLESQHGVYLSPVLPYGDTWKTLFFELLELRNLWSPMACATLENIPVAKTERFKINVFARFRPSISAIGLEANEPQENLENVEVTIPLHQRLAMIKISHNLKTNKQALKVLASEGGWFHTKWQQSHRNGDVINDENLNIDNLNQNSKSRKNLQLSSTKEEKFVAQVQTIDTKTGRVIMVAPDVGLREFSFDGAFSPTCAQADVYDRSARRLVVDFINGFNATALVYGQTGSGKSFSMFGGPDLTTSTLGSTSKHSDTGIVPRACAEVMKAVESRRESFGIESHLGVSYVEVYGDYVSDLLKHGERCGHSRVAAQRYVLDGAAEQPVHELEDISQALRVGEAQKRCAATAMNERSTRAHAIFILTLHQTCVKTGAIHTSRLFLVDLGGSEQVKKSQVHAGGHRLGAEDHFSAGFELGDHMREAVYINLGLLALKKCIEALNAGSNYIPYQDSKLTQLLSTGLGGNCKTSVIVCSRTESCHASETVSTLRFGEKCALVEMEACNNASMLASMLALLDQEIKALEEAIKNKERWEDVKVERADELVDDYEKIQFGTELVTVSRLVGAEAERRQLELLLKKRAHFVGSRPLDDDDDDDEEEAAQLASATASSSAASESVSALPNRRLRKHKAMGFGRELATVYGLGMRFDATTEGHAENSRFEDATALENVPEVIRSRGVGAWVSGAAIEEDPQLLEAKAKKIKRNRLKFSGLSL